MGTVIETTSENIGSLGKVFTSTGNAVNGIMSIAALPFKILEKTTEFVSSILAGGKSKKSIQKSRKKYESKQFKSIKRRKFKTKKLRSKSRKNSIKEKTKKR